MKITLETPQTLELGRSRTVEYHGCPPQVGSDVMLGDNHFKVKVVALSVGDPEAEPEVLVRLETVDSFVRRRDADRAAGLR